MQVSNEMRKPFHHKTLYHADSGDELFWNVLLSVTTALVALSVSASGSSGV